MGAYKDPHGGRLKNLYLAAGAAEAEQRAAGDYRSWDLTDRQLCDIELLLNGAFSPLEGFLGEADYDTVVSGMRLANGVLWPIPITLDVTEKFAEGIDAGDKLALRDLEGVVIATLEVSDVWTPNLVAEAERVYGTTDEQHPAVNYLFNIGNPVYVGGKLRGIESPTHYDFKHLRDSPAEVRARFRKLGWRRVVAFQTRNPMHRAHQELTLRAARDVEANLLIHPAVGMTKPGDVDHYTRVRCYEHLLGRYPEAAHRSVLEAEESPDGLLGKAIPHRFAAQQVEGTATYSADHEAAASLYAAIVPSPVARGTLRGIDASPALAAPGVVAFLSAKDIPGKNQFGFRVEDVTADGKAPAYVPYVVLAGPNAEEWSSLLQLEYFGRAGDERLRLDFSLFF